MVEAFGQIKLTVQLNKGRSIQKFSYSHLKSLSFNFNIYDFLERSKFLRIPELSFVSALQMFTKIVSTSPKLTEKRMRKPTSSCMIFHRKFKISEKHKAQNFM